MASPHNIIDPNTVNTIDANKMSSQSSVWNVKRGLDLVLEELSISSGMIAVGGERKNKCFELNDNKLNS